MDVCSRAGAAAQGVDETGRSPPKAPVSIVFRGGGLAVFLWSLRSGRYDNLEDAANRILV
jgi:cbb3-type cytochrome oxidase maturation protein